jgi:uncharacterized membrane protein
MLNTRGSLLTGLGLGVGVMYFLDSGLGARRRALMRDRLAHAKSLGRHAAGATRRDLAHRGTGVAARLRGTLEREAVDDVVLVERVRARIGRVVSHPRAIDVQAAGGVITLRGPILKAEVPRLQAVVARVPGVRQVVNELEEHAEAAKVPSLQGGRPLGVRFELLQRQWSPATRLITGATAAALAGYGVSRSGLPGVLLSAAGIGLLTRAATNLEMRRLTGVGAGRRAVDVQKTITVDAPVQQVFEFWSHYENFPRFMSRVFEVRPVGGERVSHWKVAGPGGMPVEFDAEVSAFVPNEVFAWRTVEGATVAHAGVVRFESAADGRTRIDVQMSYNPPGGWLGHQFASAFGVDPKHSLDEDLARMKTLLETGRPASDAAQAQHVH